jgi:hypothetical protein
MKKAQLSLGLEHPAAGVPVVPTGEHETSLRAAAELAQKGEHKSLECLVYDAIKERPRNDFELQRDLNLSGDTLRPRRWSLQKRGLVEDSGETRKAKRGQGKVWRVVEGKSYDR